MPRAAKDKNPRVEQLKRLLAIVPLARRRSGVPVEALLETFDCSAGDLFDDIRLLIMCGTPPYGPDDYLQAYIEDGRLHVNFANRFARPVRLTAEEYSGLVCALEYVGEMLGGEIAELAEGLLAKISRARVRDEDFEGVSHRMLCSSRPHEKKLALIEKAVATNAKLRVEYYSVSDEETRRRVLRPYAVLAHGHHWYVVAFCELRGEVRVFRGDRIIGLEATNKRFERPDDFDADEFREMSVVTAGKHGTPIRVRFSLEYARFVIERFPPQYIEKQADGSVDLSIRADGLSWAARWVLKHGRYARALAPEELVAEVARRCEATLALYE